MNAKQGDKINLVKKNLIFWQIGTYCLVALFVFVFFVRYSGINGLADAGFDALMTGTAYKPFVYRTLIPSLTRGMCSIIPYHEKINNFFSHSAYIQKSFQWLGWNFGAGVESYQLESVIALFLMYGCLLSFMFYFRRLHVLIYPDELNVSSFLTPLVSTVCLIVFFFFGYIYDFATLFLFTACFVFIKEKKWPLYLLFFILSCFNKETSILLALVFALEYWRKEKMSRKKFLMLITGQISIFIIIRVLLQIIYRNNSGVLVTFFLMHNIYAIIKSATGFALVAIILGIIIFYDWKKKPIFLKHAISIFPILIATMIVWGMVVEWRVFYEVYAIMILCVTDTIKRIFHKFEK